MTTKTALVTGASRRIGLGFAVARQLAELDYHVVVTARDLRQAERLAAELHEAGLAATALSLDLSDRRSIRGLADRLTDAFEHLDVLVNNASHLPDFGRRSALEVDLDALRAIFEVSVFGVWALTQDLLPLLRRAPAARIVNVTSEAAQQVGMLGVDRMMRSPAYALAKYTLNALTTTFAASLADTPILVNAVDPGRVATHPERGDTDEDRMPAEAARGIVWAATLGADGPTGGLFLDEKPVRSCA
jgi:NAD(P)-dependent dehydrogenase (short-subunit alcohol dehydrogenase family)